MPYQGSLLSVSLNSITLDDIKAWDIGALPVGKVPEIKSYPGGLGESVQGIVWDGTLDTFFWLRRSNPDIRRGQDGTLVWGSVELEMFLTPVGDFLLLSGDNKVYRAVRPGEEIVPPEPEESQPRQVWYPWKVLEMIDG